MRRSPPAHRSFIRNAASVLRRRTETNGQCDKNKSIHPTPPNRFLVKCRMQLHRRARASVKAAAAATAATAAYRHCCTCRAIGSMCRSETNFRILRLRRLGSDTINDKKGLDVYLVGLEAAPLWPNDYFLSLLSSIEPLETKQAPKSSRLWPKEGYLFFPPGKRQRLTCIYCLARSYGSLDGRILCF